MVAYSSSGADLEWAIETGEDVVELHKTETGAIIRAKSGGTAAVTVSCGNAVKKIDVSVYAGVMASDLTFDASNIISGNWYFDVNGLTGEMAAGDGYVLSDEDLDNMTLSATFSLDATAAALILRASPDMSEYILANFDRNEGIVKVWSNKREIARAGATVEDLSAVTLKAKIKDRKL